MTFPEYRYKKLHKRRTRTVIEIKAKLAQFEAAQTKSELDWTVIMIIKWVLGEAGDVRPQGKIDRLR